VGNCFSTATSTAVPGAPFDSVQFNDAGDFAGDSSFTFDANTTTLNVTRIKPTQILDSTSSVGTSGQYLSSTGTGLDWIDPLVGGTSGNIQFNDGGVLGGTTNMTYNTGTAAVNLLGNVNIGSSTAPTDRLVVTGANSAIKVKSTTTNNGSITIEDSSSGVKQLSMQLNIDTADFTSIQQGVAFRNFRFNPTADTACIGVGTTGAQAPGGIMCSNRLSNKKVILHSLGNDEHRNYSLGVNSGTFRFQVPDVLSTTRYAWFAATSSSTSNELMRLTATGNLGIGTTTPAVPLDVNGTVQCTRIIPTLVQDGGGAVGTSGQYLSSTGTGLLWTPRPLPYALSASGVGPFGLAIPVPATAATVSFAAVPRAGVYRMTTNVVAFPTAPDVTVTVEIWVRQVAGGSWLLLYNTQTFMNNTNIHMAFPAKSINFLAAANILDIYIRTGANTGSGIVDRVNIDIIECV
jgi:hypothetical protein